MHRWITIGVVACIVLSGAQTRWAQAESYAPASCTECHVKAQPQLAASVHGGDKAITCMSCHATHGKLNPKAANVPLRRANDLRTCGGCHGSALENYRSTYHGKHQALGKKNVPTCTFCHAGHELPRANPLSPLYMANVAKVCASCHANGKTDKATMAATLNSRGTGTYLYRKNHVGAVLLKLLLILFTLAVVSLGVLFLLQWIRVLRGEPAPEATAWPRWFWVQLALFGLVFAVLDQSGLLLLYASPSGGVVDRMMHTMTRPLMAVFGSDDGRSLAHRLAAIGLIVVVVAHVASYASSRRFRTLVRLPKRWWSTLWAEARRGVAPSEQPALAKGPLLYWILLIGVLLMAASGLAQWNAFRLMKSVGFGAVRYTNIVHEWLGRALAIGFYGIVLGYGVGLRTFGRIIMKRQARATAAAAAVLALIVMMSASACNSGHQAEDIGPLDVTDIPRHGSRVAPPMPGVTARVFPSAETCRGCHEREYNEWKKSYHSKSISGKTFHAMYTIFNFGSKGKRPEYCFYCHAPESKLLGKPYIAKLSSAVLAGNPLPGEGVTCAACHMITKIDPKIHLWTAAAQYDVRSAPPYHALFKTQLTQSSALCSGCHDYDNLNLKHPEKATSRCCTVYRGWETTEAAKKGVTCQACHMGNHMDVMAKGSSPNPMFALTGLKRYLDDRRHVSHIMPGSRDPAMLKKAIGLEFSTASVKGKRITAVLQIENRAGHNIPDG